MASYTYYDPQTKARASAVTTLDAGRMPTARGKGGVVADRSKFAPSNELDDHGQPIPYLLPVYMLVHLNRPGDDDDNRYVLSVHDLAWYKNSPHRRHLHDTERPERFAVELWDAGYENYETGDPEQDVSWGAMNPVMSFPLPEGTTLTGARAACEVAAHLIASGELRPPSYAGRARHERRLTRMKDQWRPVAERMLRAGQQDLALRTAQRLQAAFYRWESAPERRMYAHAERQMLRAARRADRAARSEQKRRTHVHRALTRSRA